MPTSCGPRRKSCVHTWENGCGKSCIITRISPPSVTGDFRGKCFSRWHLAGIPSTRATDTTCENISMKQIWVGAFATSLRTSFPLLTNRILSDRLSMRVRQRARRLIFGGGRAENSKKPFDADSVKQSVLNELLPTPVNLPGTRKAGAVEGAAKAAALYGGEAKRTSTVKTVLSDVARSMPFLRLSVCEEFVDGGRLIKDSDDTGSLRRVRAYFRFHRSTERTR